MDHLRALRTLGLAPGASAEEIKTAWRDLAKVWHPDRFTHDERLSRKAGENLSAINEAYDALQNYDPSVAPSMASRMRHSVAIMLEPLIPRAPIGVRHSLRILGLGPARLTGEAGTRHRSQGPRLTWILVLLLLLLLPLLVYFLVR